MQGIIADSSLPKSDNTNNMASRTSDRKASNTPQNNLLFETSWEVCNKVGGIYTVLSTKAKELQAQFGDNLIFIGPDLWSDDNPCPTFKENKRLLKSASRYATLPDRVSIRTGRWTIPGSPIVILVKYDGIYDIIDRIYGEMWINYRVDSLHSYGDYRESCVFAVASAIVLDAVRQRLGFSPADTIAHFDEWTTGMGLLYLQLIQPQIATVFTTHATSIGRSICGNGKPLYQYFHNYNGDQMAHELNMVSKHSLEKAAAHAADCFTTVSDVTADECEQLLEIRPQVITPNGFDPSFVPSAATRSKQRAKGRERLLHIASLLTGKEFKDDTFIISTSGRNEYRNKGVDLYLDTMATLRSLPDRLGRDILALVLVPAWVKEPSGALIADLDEKGDIHPTPNFLTHRLNNEDHDAITQKIYSLGGNNNNSKVTLLFCPCYLDGFDGIINISYYDLLPSLDLTLFPSYYEPWGYTPLESIAFGIPTITTDKAGFGLWVKHYSTPGMEESGVDVLSRNDNDYDEDVHKAADIICRMTTTDVRTLAKYSKAAMNTASKADWSLFISRYDDAFKTAIQRRDQRINK